MKLITRAADFGKRIKVTVEIEAYDETIGEPLSKEMQDLVKYHGSRAVYQIRELLKQERRKPEPAYLN